MSKNFLSNSGLLEVLDSNSDTESVNYDYESSGKSSEESGEVLSLSKIKVKNVMILFLGVLHQKSGSRLIVM